MVDNRVGAHQSVGPIRDLEVYGKRGRTRFRFDCACGWRGTYVTNVGRALNDQQLHALQVARAQNL